ncbi:MAG TPA: transglycosylase domain-containing protein [Candidatus Paceibacterota bacterium]|nr:transglycosylase domain-containing protein [Candidatus Paceibacterota bacterium]
MVKIRWRPPRVRVGSLKSALQNRARQLAVFLAWLATLGVIALSLFFLYARSTLPDPESIISRQVKESTKIYDSTGEKLLYDIYDEERRTVVPWERIGEPIRHATVAIEDARFYEHRGIDMYGIVRSMLENIRSGDVTGQGGSTLTQQLVGNALVGRERGSVLTAYTRKIRELILSIEVERRFTKDEILWMYLNQVPYGSNAYGIEAASQTYFAASADELSIAQAALLASLVQRPSYLSPYGYHLDELLGRKNAVIGRMFDLGFITAEERDAAIAEELAFQEQTGGLAAPHFVIMAREYVISKYGEDIVQSGGFRIITTLDADLQEAAEETVEKYAEINRENYRAGNAALVAVDPKTGQVRALVGSANYFDIENEGNFNVATAHRQPGSSFKPFAYAAAFQLGYPDSTILWDVRTEFNPKCSPEGTAARGSDGSSCYHPQNYLGNNVGPLTMRQSLARSQNTTSVKTLYLAGTDRTIDLAERMGITTLGDRSRFGLSLVLGGAEVRLVDIVSAYGVFANDGIRNPWTLIERIELADGTVLEERNENPTRVLEAQVARMVSDVLSDNNARAPVFGFNSPLYFANRPIAAKTGTTQEYRDAWVIGYTPSLAAGVWVGNNDNTPMTQAGGGISAAGPLWHEFVARALQGTPVEQFPKPDPIFADKTMLNGIYVAPDSPETHSILYHVIRSNPTGPAPSDPYQDPQFANWEWAVRARSGY